MALTRTNRIAQVFGTATSHGTGVATTSAFTPNNNSLLVVACSGIQDTDGGVRGGNFTITDSVGLTWTRRIFSVLSPSWSYGIVVWTAPVVTGVSMTVGCDCGASDIHGYRIEIFDYTDYDPNMPVGTSGLATDADGNGAAALTLAEAPLTTSEVLAFANVAVLTPGTRDVTAGGSFAQISDAGIDGWFNVQSQGRSASASPTVDWADLQAGTATVTGATMVALEIRQTPPPSPSVAWLAG